MPLFDILDGFLNPISYLVFQWSEIGTWEEKKEKMSLPSVEEQCISLETSTRN